MSLDDDQARCASEGHDFETRTHLSYSVEPMWLSCRRCERMWRVVDGAGGLEPPTGVFGPRTDATYCVTCRSYSYGVEHVCVSDETHRPLDG